MKPSNSKNQASLIKYHTERENFTKNLFEFHRHRNVNTPIINWPTFNGKSIDLYKLYNKVSSLGGWERVCEKEKWDEVALDLDPKLFQSCSNGTQALKLIYVRYLSLFEKAHTTATATIGGVDAIGLNQVPLGLGNNNSVAGISTFTGASLASVPGLSLRSSSTTLSALDNKDEESIIAGRKRFSYLIDGVPMSYNYYQHNNRNFQ